MLPTDIKTLIAAYITKPKYNGEVIDDLAELNGFNGLDNLDKLSLEQVQYLLKNPRVVSPGIWAKILPKIALKISPNNIITKLLSIHSPLAIKRIQQLPNWFDHITKNMSESLFKFALSNPYAGTILDKLFATCPEILTKYSCEFPVEKSAENLITNHDFINMCPMRTSYLLTNPSELVFERLKLYSKYIEDPLERPYKMEFLLKNENPKLLSLAIPHIQKYLSSPIAYDKLNLVSRNILNSYIISLASNHTPLASQLLEQILNMIDIYNPQISRQMVHMILFDNIHKNNKDIFSNPTDYIVNLFVNYFNNYYSGESELKSALRQMATNTNPKICELIQNKLSKYELFDIMLPSLAKNLGAITLIKSNPVPYIARPELYANPAIFKGSTNRKLVKLVSGLV